MTLLHLNALLKERYGSFSKPGLKATFSSPEIYEATTIADFLKNKEEIEVTSKWKVSELARKLRGAAMVLFTSCMYQELDPERKKALEEEDKINLTRAREVKTFEEGVKVVNKTMELMFEYLKDGDIYDVTGNLEILCSREADFVPPINNQKLYFPIIIYRPGIDLATLVSYDPYDQNLLDSQKDPSSVLDFITGLSLQPA